MIKKLLLLILVVPFFCLAQEDKKSDQNVELPDFVITGTEAVSIENSKKISPDFGSTISTEFLKPVMSPDHLELRNFINPIKENINLSDSVNYLKGRFNLGAGLYTIPKADILSTNPFNGGIFDWFASADNQRAYIINSDKYKVAGGLNLSLFTNDTNYFMPGTEVKFHGQYNLNDYKFYGATVNPAQKRTLSVGDISLGVNNFYNNYFVFALALDNEYNTLKNENLSENFLKFNGFGKLDLSTFNLNCDLTLKNQFLNNNSLNPSQHAFWGILPKIGLNISEVFKVEFGANYSRYSGNTYFNPFASMAFKIDKSLSLFGEYSPHTDLLSVSSFLKDNPYLNPGTFGTAYVHYDNSFQIALKFEYDKYFQINSGFKLLSSPEMPYFKSSIISGQFDIGYDDSHIYTVFVNMLFHLGPFGYFYGNVNLISSNDSFNSRLPYVPSTDASLIYGYNFQNIKLDSEIKLNYSSDVYIDIPNITRLGSNIDLGLKLRYQLKPMFFFTLEFSNLLFQDNYKWAAYKEMPFNVTAGISLIW
jgi:hypothetical protein